MNKFQSITIVRCNVCGAKIKTRGFNYFRHCSIQQDIKQSKILDGVVLKKPEKKAKNSQKTPIFEQKTPIFDASKSTKTNDFNVLEAEKLEEIEELKGDGLEDVEID